MNTRPAFVFRHGAAGRGHTQVHPARPDAIGRQISMDRCASSGAPCRPAAGSTISVHEQAERPHRPGDGGEHGQPPHLLGDSSSGIRPVAGACRALGGVVSCRRAMTFVSYRS